MDIYENNVQHILDFCKWLHKNLQSKVQLIHHKILPIYLYSNLLHKNTVVSQHSIWCRNYICTINAKTHYPISICFWTHVSLLCSSFCSFESKTICSSISSLDEFCVKVASNLKSAAAGKRTVLYTATQGLAISC